MGTELLRGMGAYRLRRGSYSCMGCKNWIKATARTKREIGSRSLGHIKKAIRTSMDSWRRLRADIEHLRVVRNSLVVQMNLGN